MVGHDAVVGRITRGVCVLLLVPLALTMYAAVAATWFALWGVGNVVHFSRTNEPGSLTRGVAGLSRSVGVVGAVARGWGSLSGAFPPLGSLAEAGKELTHSAGIGLRVAPRLPAALGYDGPRRYLVCALNDAELFGSGGAPLYAALVELNQGRPNLADEGSVSVEFNPANRSYAWPGPAVCRGMNPVSPIPLPTPTSIRTSRYLGGTLASAWQKLGFPPVDGVVTADIYAVASILDRVGPVWSSDYGSLTSENVIAKVLVEAYREFPIEVEGANDRRREMNERLRRELGAHLLQRFRLPQVAQGLWAARPVGMCRHSRLIRSSSGL